MGNLNSNNSSSYRLSTDAQSKSLKINQYIRSLELFIDRLEKTYGDKTKCQEYTNILRKKDILNHFYDDKLNKFKGSLDQKSDYARFFKYNIGTNSAALNSLEQQKYISDIDKIDKKEIIEQICSDVESYYKNYIQTLKTAVNLYKIVHYKYSTQLISRRCILQKDNKGLKNKILYPETFRNTGTHFYESNRWTNISKSITDELNRIFNQPNKDDNWVKNIDFNISDDDLDNLTTKINIQRPSENINGINTFSKYETTNINDPLYSEFVKNGNYLIAQLDSRDDCSKFNNTDKSVWINSSWDLTVRNIVPPIVHFKKGSSENTGSGSAFVSLIDYNEFNKENTEDCKNLFSQFSSNNEYLTQFNKIMMHQKYIMNTLGNIIDKMVDWVQIDDTTDKLEENEFLKISELNKRFMFLEKYTDDILKEKDESSNIEKLSNIEKELLDIIIKDANYTNSDGTTNKDSNNNIVRRWSIYHMELEILKLILLQYNSNIKFKEEQDESFNKPSYQACSYIQKINTEQIKKGFLDTYIPVVSGINRKMTKAQIDKSILSRKENLNKGTSDIIADYGLDAINNQVIANIIQNSSNRPFKIKSSSNSASYEISLNDMNIDYFKKNIDFILNKDDKPLKEILKVENEQLDKSELNEIMQYKTEDYLNKKTTITNDYNLQEGMTIDTKKRILDAFFEAILHSNLITITKTYKDFYLKNSNSLDIPNLYQLYDDPSKVPDDFENYYNNTAKINIKDIISIIKNNIEKTSSAYTEKETIIKGINNFIFTLFNIVFIDVLILKLLSRYNETFINIINDNKSIITSDNSDKIKNDIIRIKEDINTYIINKLSKEDADSIITNYITFNKDFLNSNYSKREYNEIFNIIFTIFITIKGYDYNNISDNIYTALYTNTIKLKTNEDKNKIIEQIIELFNATNIRNINDFLNKLGADITKPEPSFSDAFLYITNNLIKDNKNGKQYIVINPPTLDTSLQSILYKEENPIDNSVTQKTIFDFTLFNNIKTTLRRDGNVTRMIQSKMPQNNKTKDNTRNTGNTGKKDISEIDNDVSELMNYVDEIKRAISFDDTRPPSNIDMAVKLRNLSTNKGKREIKDILLRYTYPNKDKKTGKMTNIPYDTNELIKKLKAAFIN